MSEPESSCLVASRIVATPRIAITAIFLVQALIFASWTAHIPQVKASLGLSDATLGTALLGAPIGSIVAMIVTGWLLPRLGSKRIVQIVLIGYCLTGVGVGLAGSLPELFGALALWGLFQGALDVAMSTQGITIERAMRSPIMSGLHGGWSIGAFTGAAIGAIAVANGIPLDGQLLTLGIVLLAVTGWLSLQLLPDPIAKTASGHHAKASFAILKHPAVLTLSGIAFACMLGEGAAADWSAVYLHDSLDSSAAVAGFGYAAFSLTMVTLRLGGNRLLARTSPRVILPVLTGIATIGFTLGLVIQTPVAALIGFAALGIGLALIVPTVFSAAGALSGQHAGTAIAAVSALGWAGFVCGPPLIGHLAEWTSLPLALGIIPLLTAVIAIVTRSTGVLTKTTP
ncbi:MAG: MFS transporter [Thermomicrobiales bacterium]